MLQRLRALFGRPPVVVEGVDKLPEGEARRVALGDPLAGGVELVLCRVDGVLHALDRRCPHEGGRIQDGPLAQGRYAVCPLHNYKFDPRTGKAVGINCRSARVYRVRERGADCEIRV